MTRRIDTASRLLMLAAAVVAVVLSFSVAADSDLDAATRFLSLTALAAVALTGLPGLDIIQAYVRRRPLRLRWGKPAADAPPPIRPPLRILPSEDPIILPLSLSRSIAGFAASAAFAVIFGTIGFALARTASADGGLLIYLFFAAAVWLAVRYGIRLATHRRALIVSSEGARLGAALGYLPPLNLDRASISAIEMSAEPPMLVLVAEGRRHELDLDLFAEPDLARKVAGVWPETPWLELSQYAMPTELIRRG